MDKQTAEKLKTALVTIKEYCGVGKYCMYCMFYDPYGHASCKFRNYYPEQWKDEWIETSNTKGEG